MSRKSIPDPGGDTVRERRAQIARLASIAKRLGLACFLVATVVLMIGLATTFSEAFSNAVVALLVVGSVILAPAIIFGYATTSAERQDRQRGI